MMFHSMEWMIDNLNEGVRKGSIHSYSVRIDMTDDLNIIVDFFIKPVKTIEFIRLDTIVTKTGVKFDQIQ